MSAQRPRGAAATDPSAAVRVSGGTRVGLGGHHTSHTIINHHTSRITHRNIIIVIIIRNQSSSIITSLYLLSHISHLPYSCHHQSPPIITHHHPSPRTHGHERRLSPSHPSSHFTHHTPPIIKHHSSSLIRNSPIIADIHHPSHRHQSSAPLPTNHPHSLYIPASSLIFPYPPSCTLYLLFPYIQVNY